MATASRKEPINKREARRILAESRALLKRGRRRLASEAVAEMVSMHERLTAAIASADAAAIDAAASELETATERRLGFARKSKFREYVESIGLAVMLALTLRAFFVEAYNIPTGSMEPSLLVGDYLFVSKSHYGVRIPFTTRYLTRWRDIQRGDVVVFEFPVEEVRTQLAIGILMKQLDDHRRQNGGYPTSLDPLPEIPASAAAVVNGRRDAWQTPFRYEVEGDVFRLASAGADRIFDTDDDLNDRNSAFRRGLDACLDADSLRVSKDYIKRVIGLPGDIVEVRGDIIYVNGEPIEQSDHEPTALPYPAVERATESMETGRRYTVQFDGRPDDAGPIEVRPDHIFVMGDNRDNSSDGRCWGQVPIDNVKGRAVVILFSRDARSGGIRTNRLFQSVYREPGS